MTKKQAKYEYGKAMALGHAVGRIAEHWAAIPGEHATAMTQQCAAESIAYFERAKELRPLVYG